MAKLLGCSAFNLGNLIILNIMIRFEQFLTPQNALLALVSLTGLNSFTVLILLTALVDFTVSGIFSVDDLAITAFLDSNL